MCQLLGRRARRRHRNGAIKLVTMGDSVPVVGDKPTFPDRLASLLGGLAPVENRNIAVGGTLSTHWLPGTSHCDNILLPEIADAVGASLSAVKVRAHRGYEKIRSLLPEEGV